MSRINQRDYWALLAILLMSPPAVATTINTDPDGGVSEETQAAADREMDTDTTTAAPPLTPPVLKTFKEAAYPEQAMADRIEAEVILEIDIDAEGSVEGVSVAAPAEPSGYGFDEAATEAAFGFVFEPAREGEVPVPVRITYKYRFVLSEPEAAPEVAKTPAVETTRPDTPGSDFTGRLLERGTRLPLAGVTVIVFKGEGESSVGFEATTDETGAFSFVDLTPGEWRVLAEPEGYFPLRTTETLVSGELTETKYYVEKGTYNPYDVLVEEEQVKKEVNRTTLSITESETVPGTFGDVLNVVKNLPGVARTGAIGGNLVIRGSSPEDSAIYIDSVEVPILYHFVGLKSVVPAGMLESIDFYPGNFSVYYGRATGGIVDVKLKELNPEKIGGYLDVNLLDSGLYLEAPIGKKLAVAVGFRRSYFDGIIKQAASFGAPVTLETAPRYYDYQLLAQFTPNAKHRLKAFFFGSDDRLVAVVKNPADISPELRATEARTATTFYRTIIDYRFAPSEEVQNELKLSSGRNDVFVGLGDQLYLDLNFYTAQVRDTLTLSPAKGLRFRAGLDYLFNKTDMRIKFPSVAKEGEFRSSPINDTVQLSEGRDMVYHAVAGFFETEVLLFDRLAVIPGLRYDYFSRVDEGALSPRLVLRLGLNDQWTLKGGVGFFYQEPPFDETDAVFGNPDLGLESATHYSAGVEFSPLEYLSFDVTLFYKNLHDLVSRTTETVIEDGEITPLNFNNGGTGRVKGIELLVRHRLANNFSGWISYTLSRAERKDYGADDYRLFDFDQTHILTFVGNYQLPKNWSIGARYRLVTGRLYTPRVGSVFNSDRGVYEPIPGETNSDRMPMFHQLDLRIDKRWIFESWIFTAYLDIQNAYNRTNPEGYRYNFDSSEKQVRSGLPIIPVIGIKGEF